MEYPPTKQHHIALHELRKELIYEKYKESFQNILGLAGNDVMAQLEVLHGFCSAYIIMGKLKDAKEIIEKVRDISSSGVAQHKAFGLIIESAYHSNIRETELSIVEADEALSLLEDHSDELYFMTLQLKAGHAQNSNNFEEGIRLCREIVEKAESNLVNLHATVYTRLGNMYDLIGEFDDAKINYEQALVLFQRLGYLRNIAGTYSNLGSLAFFRFQADPTNEYHIESVIKYSHLALEVISNTSDTEYKINILANLGNAYAIVKNFSEAIKYGKEALTVARATKLNISISTGLLLYGEILQMAGQFDESLKYLEECITYSDFLSTERLQVDLYYTLTEVCNDLRLYEKGFKYFQRHVELLKKYDEQAKAGILYHNKILAEKLQQQENELHKLQLRTIQEKMQAQAAQLVTQTDLLAKFRDELREITRKYATDSPGMREVKEKLKELPCKQIDWEKFETEFAAVHPEFTKKLYGLFPTLTPMEMKMCSLLRLNLKSQEIARLFCLSERSIETHRFNIRRKLGIGREHNLSNYLNSL